MRGPRLLVLIGSGELAPQMARVQRAVIRRLARNGGPSARHPPIRAAIIDTPYGFQSNADALSEELVDFFGRRLGLAASIASFRRSDDDVLARETAFACIREADFVFSGPGSPSYALRQWSDSPIAALLGEKLAGGGALVLASAAALTAGRLSAPVYEIYKAGEDPHWLPGLDVLATIGIQAAVIPHFDNREGRDHDTRFCFLGERRLAALEEQMADDLFILGIDEHTALVVDVDESRATVHGRGQVTVRRQGQNELFGSGVEFPMTELTQPAGHLAGRERRPARSASPEDASALAQLVLDLEGRIAALSERAALTDQLIETLIKLRTAARASADYDTADAIRDRLLRLGIELSDSEAGTEVRLPGSREEG